LAARKNGSKLGALSFEFCVAVASCGILRIRQSGQPCRRRRICAVAGQSPFEREEVAVWVSSVVAPLLFVKRSSFLRSY
jgi:hypothetical protein